MGTTLLSVLPKSRPWVEVVALLDADAAVADVVSASAVAAERDLARAANDPVFVETLRLLSSIPKAAGAADFGRALRNIGVPAGDEPGVLDLAAATGDALDLAARQASRTNDFSELARRALLTTLSAHIGERLPGFFEATSEEVRVETARLATPAEFSRLARTYFTDLLQRTLGYWLDRTLSAQVGPGRRFAGAGERAEFDAAMQQFCLEATRIISEFSTGWYGKRVRREAPISSQEAAGFGAVAFRKITTELRRKWGGDE